MSAYIDWKRGGCLFECHLCGVKTKSLKDHVKHILYDEEISYDTYQERRNGRNTMIEEKNVKCAKCGMKILWDELAMETHLKRRHGDMKLKQYYAMYIQTSDDEVTILEERQPQGAQVRQKYTSKFQAFMTCRLC